MALFSIQRGGNQGSLGPFSPDAQCGSGSLERAVVWPQWALVFPGMNKWVSLWLPRWTSK